MKKKDPQRREKKKNLNTEGNNIFIRSDRIDRTSMISGQMCTYFVHWIKTAFVLSSSVTIANCNSHWNAVCTWMSCSFITIIVPWRLCSNICQDFDNFLITTYLETSPKKERHHRCPRTHEWKGTNYLNIYNNKIKLLNVNFRHRRKKHKSIN